MNGGEQPSVQQLMAFGAARAALDKCQEAATYFDELVAALALCGQTARVALLSRAVLDVRRQLSYCDRELPR